MGNRKLLAPEAVSFVFSQKLVFLVSYEGRVGVMGVIRSSSSNVASGRMVILNLDCMANRDA